MNNYSSDRTDNQISAYYLVEISKTNLNHLILFHFHEGGHEIRINRLYRTWNLVTKKSANL